MHDSIRFFITIRVHDIINYRRIVFVKSVLILDLISVLLNLYFNIQISNCFFFFFQTL